MRKAYLRTVVTPQLRVNCLLIALVIFQCAFEAMASYKITHKQQHFWRQVITLLLGGANADVVSDAAPKLFELREWMYWFHMRIKTVRSVVRGVQP